MLTERDNIHYNYKKIDSYNKPFVMIQSSRELGKTTAIVLDKAWAAFKRGQTTLIMRYKVVDITEAYIKSIQFILNKFIDEKIELKYSKSAIKEGIVYVYIEDKLFCCIVGLSIDVGRIKSLVLPNVGLMFLDEYVLNPKFKERYPIGVWDRISEAYNTFYRETEVKLKCYFIGNCYSKYNPIHEHFKIPYEKMIPGCFIVGEDYVYEAAVMCDELYNKILERNPLYIRNSEYRDYALGGVAVNDKNIKIGKLRNDFSLHLVIDFGDQIVGVYKNEDSTADIRYFCGDIKYDNVNRDIYCFDFADLMDGSTLYNKNDAFKFEMLRAAMRKNKVEYKDIATYYKIVAIYNI